MFNGILAVVLLVSSLYYMERKLTNKKLESIKKDNK